MLILENPWLQVEGWNTAREEGNWFGEWLFAVFGYW